MLHRSLHPKSPRLPRSRGLVRMECAKLKQGRMVRITLTIPASDPAGPIHLPTFRMSRVQRLLESPNQIFY
jgi:hypothetical protein